MSPDFSTWAPQTVAISCTVMEHASGDPVRVAAKVEEAVKKAAADASAALGVPGAADDVIGSQVLQIDIGEMIPKKPMKQFGNINYNFDSPLLSDGDASYKLYFEVFVEKLVAPTVL